MRRMTRGLIIDVFCGGGGASTGISMATGRSPDIVIDKDRDVLRIHAARNKFSLVGACAGAIGMRMLTPRELFRAQGFPESYIIDRDTDGRLISRSTQVRAAGNAVCPPIAAAIVRCSC
jgi:site-specific DNA-cytosine methylase